MGIINKIRDTKIFQLFGSRIFIILGVCILGYLLLVGCYCIPTNGSITQNLERSADKFNHEVTQYDYMENPNSEVDLLSDAIYMMVSGNKTNNNPFIDAIECNYPYFKYDIDGAEVQAFAPIDFLRVYNDNNIDFQLNFLTDNLPVQTDDIKDKVADAKETSYSYGRYWHGYQLWLKPLLLFFDYGTIRSIMMCVIIILFMWLFIETWKKSKALALALIPMFIALNPLSLFLCIMYFSMSVLLLITMLIIVKFSDKFINSIHKTSLLFLIVGCLAQYFDVMSFPFITMILPMCLYIILYWKEKNITIKQALYLIINLGFNWCLGFVSLLLIKNAVLFIISPDAFNNGTLSNSAKWFGTTPLPYTSIVAMIFSASLQPILTFSLILLSIITAYLCIKYKYITKKLIIPTIIFALAPCILILIIQNHCLTHLHYSNKEFVMFYYALFSFLCVNIEMIKQENNINKLIDLF